MANAHPDSASEIIDRVLNYLKNDEGIDLIYLNNELVTLSDSITRTGISKLDIN